MKESIGYLVWLNSQKEVVKHIHGKVSRPEGLRLLKTTENLCNLLGLVEEDKVKALKSILQIMSKGAVCMSDLRCHLQEYLPVAINVFSTAAFYAGVTETGTPRELYEYMESNKLPNEAILPYVSNVMEGMLL